jgi:hypothetical protein
MAGWLLVVGTLYFSWRYAWWRPPVDARRPRILMYHMVSDPRPGAGFNGLRVTRRVSSAQLAWLRRQGYVFFTVSELLWAMGPTAREEPSPSPSMTATPTTCTMPCRYWKSTMPAPPCTWSSIAMTATGPPRRRSIMTPGNWRANPSSATRSAAPAGERPHRDRLAHADPYQHARHAGRRHARHELAASKQQLEQAFRPGRPVRSFAYPFGHCGGRRMWRWCARPGT